MVRAGLALFLIVVGVYLPSVNFDFIYDDRVVILDQPARLDRAVLRRVFTEPYYPGMPYHRPLTRLSFLVQKHWHGDNPRPFHLANVLMMGLAAVLAFAFFSRPVFRLPPAAAWAAALALALHPVASSCVHPIAGRDTLLGGLLMLAALHAWLAARPSGRLLAGPLLLAALLAKEQALILPVLFLLADAAGLSAAPWTARVRRRPAWLLVLVLPLLLYAASRAAVTGTRSLAELTAAESPLLFPLSFLFGLQVIFAPFSELVYEPPVSTWFSLPRLGLALALTALLAAGLRRARPADRPVFFFWLGWFFLAQLPTANLFDQETRFDERFVFFALPAVLGPAARLAADHWRSRPDRRRLLAAAAAVLFLLGGGLSHIRGYYFRTEADFYRQWLKTNPAEERAWNNMGLVLADARLYDEALAMLEEAVRLDPEYIEGLYNLGNVLQETGRYADAAGYFRRALALNPDQVMVHNNLGLALRELDDRTGAAHHFRAALMLDPESARAHGNLGQLLLEDESFGAAAFHLERALALDPGDMPALVALVRLLIHPQSGRRRDPARAASLAAAAADAAGASERHRLLLLLAEAREAAGRPAAAAAAREKAAALESGRP